MVLTFTNDDNWRQHNMDQSNHLMLRRMWMHSDPVEARFKKPIITLCGESRESGVPMQTKLPSYSQEEGAPSRDECSYPILGYTDELASAEDMASIRAREILAAGVAQQLAIKKAVDNAHWHQSSALIRHEAQKQTLEMAALSA